MGQNETNSGAIELEYELISMLAEKRWASATSTQEIDMMISKVSHYFIVGEDGLVNLGLGVC